MTLSDPTTYSITIEVSAAQMQKLSERALAARLTVADLVKREALKETHPTERVVSTIKAEEGEKRK